MKSLFTVDCWDSERIIVPFDASRTCAELQAEVSRRIEADDALKKFGYAIAGLRIQDYSGPRLFKDDVLGDVILPNASGNLHIFLAIDPTPLQLGKPDLAHGFCTESLTVSNYEPLDINTSLTFSAPVTPDTLVNDGLSEHEDNGHKMANAAVQKMSNIVQNGALQRNERIGSLKAQVPASSSLMQPGRILDCAENKCDDIPDRPSLLVSALSKNTEKQRSAYTWYGLDDSVKTESCCSHSAASSNVAMSDTNWYFGAEDAPQIRYDGKNRVEWMLPCLREKLDTFAKGTRIFSPEFTIYDLPLSLVFYPNGNTNAKPGYCSLGLKAQHGCHLRYKLFVGNTEKYTELRHNVTESWGFVDMYRIDDDGTDTTGNLVVGVEIISDIDKDDVTRVSDNKVEWTLCNMTEKMRFYRKDVALYSQEFSLAGVDRLRIKFYPNGKKEADNEWCSLYLEAPKGSEIRVRLSLGQKSMSFDRIEKFGEDSIWGFLALCKIADEIDNDEVKLGVEIMETKRLDSRLSESEDAYLKSLPSEERIHLLGELCRIEKLRNHDADVPSRFRILNLALPDAAKAVALQKWDSLQNDAMSGESSKIRKWIDGLLSLPIGKITRPVVSMIEGQNCVKTYLDRAKESLNLAVFGHEEPKEKILQLICQWISNPDSMSLVMGIQGPPGNGKTSLCRKGIAEALGRPFVQISLGGASDGAVLEGHSFTYVGSTWGRISQMLMDARSMNPVIFFDELDKVSATSRGDEIIGVLTHLTDHTQNKIFSDRYFEGIPMDMSKAMFIFSFNDESKINHVLKDRLTIINTEGFKFDQQLTIAQRYLLPELLQNVGMKNGDVFIEGLEDLRFLCDHCGLKDEKGGVRGLKKALEACVLHINKRRLLELDDDCYKANGPEESVAKAADENPPHAVPIGAELTMPGTDVKRIVEMDSDEDLATTAAGSPEGKQFDGNQEWNNDSEDEPEAAERCGEVQQLRTIEEAKDDSVAPKSEKGKRDATGSSNDSEATDKIEDASSSSNKDATDPEAAGSDKDTAVATSGKDAPSRADDASDATVAEGCTSREHKKIEEQAAAAPRHSRVKKLPKFALPLSLTKENIEWLLPKRPVADEGYRMMYM